jgi:hypothetical protein
MSDRVECGIDDCDNQSRYLLTCGNRCPKHAREDQPETVEYINWATGAMRE